MAIRSIIRSPIRSVLRGSVSGDAISLEDFATDYLGGITPDIFFDFIHNRAIIDGVTYGNIASIPNFAGTLNISAAGHLVAGNANILTISSQTFTYPFSFGVEGRREADTGTAQVLLQMDAGSNNERSYIAVASTDNLSGVVVDGAANVYNQVLKTGVALNEDFRASVRVEFNNCVGANLGALATPTDTTATMPDAPTIIRIGGVIGPANAARSWLRYAWIFRSALSDANLTLTSTP